MFIWNQRVAILEAVIQAESQIVSWLQSEGEGFLREKKRNNYMKRRKNSYWGWQAELLLSTYDWLLILSLNRKSIIISPCGQDVFFPAGFTNNCLEDNHGLAQSE